MDIEFRLLIFVPIKFATEVRDPTRSDSLDCRRVASIDPRAALRVRKRGGTPLTIEGYTLPPSIVMSDLPSRVYRDT